MQRNSSTSRLSLLTLVAFDVFVRQLIHSSAGVVFNHLGQNPLGARCDLTSRQLVGLGRHTGLKFTRRLQKQQQQQQQQQRETLK